MNLVSPWWYVLLPESVRVFGKAFHFDKCVGEVTVLETERIDSHNSTFESVKRVEEKLCKAEMADSEHTTSRSDLYNILPEMKKSNESFSRNN